MAETKKSLKDYKMPGSRTPRNMGKVEKAKDVGGTLKRLWGYFRSEKAAMILLLLVVFVVVVCGILAPKFQSGAIDAIAENRFDDIFPLLIRMAVVYGVAAAGTLMQGRISALISQRTVKKMRQDLFVHIVDLKTGYLDSHSHGDIMSRMTNDVENVSTTVSQSVGSLFSGVLTLIGTVFMMFYYCPRLAVLSCSTVILTVVVTRVLSRAMRKAYVKRQELLGSLNGTVEEMVSSYQTVTAYEREEKVTEGFCAISDELTKVGIRAEILGGSMGPMMNLINNIGFVVIAAFGGYFAYKGMISVGIISAFIIYAKQFGRPIDEIAQVWGQIQTAIAGAERVFAVMDAEKEDQSGKIPMEEVLQKQAEISFENVNFSYVEGRRVLKDFSLRIRPGQKVALVGATGSGKTTVVNLLMRFYKPDSGSIKINGVDISEIELKSLRDATAIVLQDTVLFADTVRNNLKYSNPEISDEEMIRCAKECHVHNLINTLENGYDTKISADAGNFSEGQKQLLSIARAFVSSPGILILDEATSNVDTRTEKHIQDAMVRLMRGRTSVVIAHRLSTIRDADVIVVLDQGHIAEMGTHEELLSAGGRYSDLYSRQFSGNAT